jgi:phosphoribosylformylglycinamidine synthase
VTLAEDPFVALFSESTARALVTCRDADVDRLLELAAQAGVAVARLGRTGGDVLRVAGSFELPVAELRGAHEATLPRLLA